MALSAAALDAKAMANDERDFLMTGDEEFAGELDKRTATVRDRLQEAIATAPSGEALVAHFTVHAG